MLRKEACKAFIETLDGRRLEHNSVERLERTVVEPGEEGEAFFELEGRGEGKELEVGEGRDNRASDERLDASSKLSSAAQRRRIGPLCFRWNEAGSVVRSAGGG